MNHEALWLEVARQNHNERQKQAAMNRLAAQARLGQPNLTERAMARLGDALIASGEKLKEGRELAEQAADVQTGSA